MNQTQSAPGGEGVEVDVASVSCGRDTFVEVVEAARRRVGGGMGWRRVVEARRGSRYVHRSPGAINRQQFGHRNTVGERQ